ncbi:MAG: tetratricopeptide repeat protein [Planctomycetes bacterium]|nr:tetratricopeptide repeat protein [Planctomycetota bacterium]
MASSAEEYIQNALDLIDEELNEEALNQLQKAVELEPQSAHAWYCMGCVYNTLDDRKNAIRAFQQCTKFAPDRPEGWYNLGNGLKEMGAYEVAEKCFEIVVQLSPDDADAWINLGFVLDEQGKHQSAIECYDKAIPLAPDDVVAWTNRGNSLASLGDGAEAEKCYLKAIELDENYDIVYLAYGRLLVAAGEFAKGVEVLKEATKRMPQEGWAWYMLAYAMAKTDRPREATVVIERAMMVAEENADLWNNIGEVHHLLGNEVEALRSYQKACKIQPNYVHARLGMARCFLLKGEKENARDACDYYLEHAADEELKAEVANWRKLCE